MKLDPAWVINHTCRNNNNNIILKRGNTWKIFTTAIMAGCFMNPVIILWSTPSLMRYGTGWDYTALGRFHLTDGCSRILKIAQWLVERGLAAMRTSAVTGSHCEYELLNLILTQKPNTSLTNTETLILAHIWCSMLSHNWCLPESCRITVKILYEKKV